MNVGLYLLVCLKSLLHRYNAQRRNILQKGNTGLTKNFVIEWCKKSIQNCKVDNHLWIFINYPHSAKSHNFMAFTIKSARNYISAHRMSTCIMIILWIFYCPRIFRDRICMFLYKLQTRFIRPRFTRNHADSFHKTLMGNVHSCLFLFKQKLF